MAPVRNDAQWLAKMELFCSELKLYLFSETHVTFPRSVPDNQEGLFDNLCEMSVRCAYVSEIDTVQHGPSIVRIQKLARCLLRDVGRHPAMEYTADYTKLGPFFEKALFTALTLGVEHQDACGDTFRGDANLPVATTTCS
jgi:hypothetical protein